MVSRGSRVWSKSTGADHLADPRNDNIRNEINQKIKRELFRPFAPSVIYEESKDSFKLIVEVHI